MGSLHIRLSILTDLLCQSLMASCGSWQILIRRTATSIRAVIAIPNSLPVRASSWVFLGSKNQSDSRMRCPCFCSHFFFAFPIFYLPFCPGQQVSKQASKQASKTTQSSKSKPASKHARTYKNAGADKQAEQASKQEQVSQQSSKR